MSPPITSRPPSAAPTVTRPPPAPVGPAGHSPTPVPAPAVQQHRDGFDGGAAPGRSGGLGSVGNNREFLRLPAETQTRVLELERTAPSRQADGNLARVATSPGFNRLPAARQSEMLDAYSRNPESRAVSTELTAMANNTRFRSLNDATQTQAIGIIGAQGGGTSVARVAGSPGFDRLSRTSQEQMLNTVNAHPHDAPLAGQLTRISGDEHFRGLPQATQSQVVDQLNRHGAGGQATTLATAVGFGQLPRAQQEQMLNSVNTHPTDARHARDLASLANSGNFRTLPEPTQRQAIDLVNTHGAGSAIPALATTRGFSQLAPAQQTQALNGMNAHPTDTRLAHEYAALGNNAGFRGLNDATQTQAINQMGVAGSGTAIPTLATHRGFGDVTRPRQEQMLNTLNAHPRDTAMARTLGGLSDNTAFRALPDASQLQLVTMVGAGQATPATLALATSPNFAQVAAPQQQEMLTQLAAHPADARVVRDYATLSGNAAFRALPAASQTRLINDLATISATDQVRGLDEAAILARGNTAAGAGELRALCDVMRQGGVNASERTQISRVGAATFTPGVGMVLNGSAADQATFTNMLRREMLRSPSFDRLMNTQNADAAHPLNLTVGRNQPGHFVDAFNAGGNHTFDLSDVEAFPDRPPAGFPDAMTQGQNLMHGMAEARQGALHPSVALLPDGTPVTYRPAHRAAIVAENEYRRDIGQHSQLRMPPNDTLRGAPNTTFQYNNGYTETTLGGTTITGINRTNPPP